MGTRKARAAPEVGPRSADATPVAQSVVAVVVEPVVVSLLMATLLALVVPLLTPPAPLEAASVTAPVVQTGLLLGGSGRPAPLLTLRGPVPPIGAGPTPQTGPPITAGPWHLTGLLAIRVPDPGRRPVAETPVPLVPALPTLPSAALPTVLALLLGPPVLSGTPSGPVGPTDGDGPRLLAGGASTPAVPDTAPTTAGLSGTLVGPACLIVAGPPALAGLRVTGYCPGAEKD